MSRRLGRSEPASRPGYEACIVAGGMANARSNNTRRMIEPSVSYPEFTRLLLLKKNEILARSLNARQNLDEQVIDSPGDEADSSVVDTSADYFLKLANTFQDELREIDAAFERMTRRVYGQCESCDEPIGQARLRYLPEARLCIDCQSLTERNHASAFPRARPKL